MAGRLSKYGTYRFLLVLMTLGLVGTILAATGAWNPVPQLEAWWQQMTKLSEPQPVWKLRLGGTPDMTAVMPNSGPVIAASYGRVTAYRAFNGEQLWSYPAYWALPAGDVVVIRAEPTNRNQTNHKGYTVLDPHSGATLWSDQKSNAVWAFTDQIVELECPEAGDCELRGRSHRDQGAVLWKATLPPNAKTLKGAAPGLVGLRDPADWFATAARGAPGPIPPVFGLRVDDSIQIIDTTPPGRRVREIVSTDQQVRLTFAGERVLVAQSQLADSGCRYTIEGRTFGTDVASWTVRGLDLGTGSGTVCAQRHDPMGARGRVFATDADRHPVLLDATDGKITWRGVPGEGILATDGQLAVIVGADRKTVRVVDILAPDATPSYTAEFGLEPQAAVTRDYVVIRDQDAGRILVLSHFGGTDGKLPLLLEIKTRATIVAIGSGGMLLSSGRTIGYLPLR